MSYSVNKMNDAERYYLMNPPRDLRGNVIKNFRWRLLNSANRAETFAGACSYLRQARCTPDSRR